MYQYSLYFIGSFLLYSQISTKAKVTGSLPSAGSWPARSNEGLAEALTGADVVVIPAGVPRKPGMTRDDLFNVSSSVPYIGVQTSRDYSPKFAIGSVVCSVVCFIFNRLTSGDSSSYCSLLLQLFSPVPSFAHVCSLLHTMVDECQYCQDSNRRMCRILPQRRIGYH
jgi:hypothetical protein